MLLLLCDAPFLTKMTPYMVIRSRRTAWCLGECMYIIMAAFVYTCFLSLLTMIILLPVAEMSSDWGSVVHDVMYGTETMSRTQIIELYDFEWKINSDLYRYIYPMQGHLYTFMAVWGSFSFIGLLMYMVSLMSKKLLPGMCASGIFIFIDPILEWVEEANGLADCFSPVSWTSLDRMSSPVKSKMMTISMALVLYVVLCVTIVLITWYISKWTMIEVKARK